MLHSIYMEPQYLEIERLRGGGTPEVFCYSEGTHEIKYLFLRKHAGRVDSKDYWSISVPPRGNCGFVISSDADDETVKRFNKAWDEYCRDTGIVCEYTKLDYWNTIPKSITDRYSLRLHSQNYSIDLSGDFFAHEFNKSRRVAVRAAQRKGITTEIGGKEWIEQFYQINRFTELKFGLSSEYCCSKEYWERCFELFPKDCRIMLAFLGEQAIAGSFIMMTSGIIHVTFAGERPDFAGSGAYSLMDYEVCKFGQSLGCKLYDMGNAVIGSGLELYKKSFVRKSGPRPCYVAKRITNESVYHQLITINGRRDNWFPEFNLIP